MRVHDETIDARLVSGEEGVDVSLVEMAGSLRLGEDEVEDEEEAGSGVERNPGENEVSVGFGEG